MPFYEYTCSSCGHHHEELQKVSDKPLRKCPECGRNTLSRIVSAPVFRLKGGGWYETDFKSDADRKRNLAGERDDSPKSEATDTVEKKPEAAAKEAKPVAAEPTKASKSAGKRPPKSAPAKAPPRKAAAKAAKPARKTRR